MHLIRKKIYILTLPFLLFSHSNDVRASCEFFIARSYDSNSCYCNDGDLDSGDWIIEASVKTLKELEIEEGLASATIRNVRRVLERKNVKSGGILYSYNASNKLERQDCKIYTMVSRGVIDENKIIMNQYTSDCIGEATYFVNRLAKIIDNKSANISGLDKVLFRSSPNEELSLSAKKNKFGLSFLIANSNAMKSLIFASTEPEATTLRKEFIFYPYSLYEVKKGDTLSNVASKVADSSENWPMIWAMNTENLPGARELVKGKSIKVPAPIENWITKYFKWQDTENIALKQYGTSELKNLVEKICKYTKDTSYESPCTLPQFYNSHGLEKLHPGFKSDRQPKINP